MRTPAPRLGPHSPGLRQGPSPSRHLGWPLRSLSPAHGLGSLTPRLVPLADDLAKLQPPLLHLLDPRSHLLLGRRSLFSSRLRLCPRRHRCLWLQLIAERPKVLKLSKRGLKWQGRPSRGTPTPPGYGYLTRHLPRKATHAWLSGSASRQASPSARNEGETRYYTQIPRCSGLDSHNEQTFILRVPLQTGLRFHSRGYEQPPHQRACGTTNSRWLADDQCTSKRWPPQSAPAGPHSRSRHKNENGTVPEHEYRPRGVRRVVQSTAQGGPGRSRPARGTAVARVEDGQLHPGPVAAVRLPPHGWRMPFSLECRRKKRVAGPRGGRPRLASPSSPARMMKILEAEGGVEAAARLASPHHRTGGHHPG
jgi:hypothetical protein